MICPKCKRLMTVPFIEKNGEHAKAMCDFYLKLDCGATSKRKPRMKTLHEGPNGWSPWQQPIRKGYRLACCDCGLVHNFDFRLVKCANGGHFIQFRVSRNRRSTALCRRRKSLVAKVGKKR